MKQSQSILSRIVIAGLVGSLVTILATNIGTQAQESKNSDDIYARLIKELQGKSEDSKATALVSPVPTSVAVQKVPIKKFDGRIRIKEVRVEDGSEVNQGDVIMVLDLEGYTAREKAADEAVTNAKRNLEKAKSELERERDSRLYDVEKAEWDLKSAETELKYWNDWARKDEITSAELRVKGQEDSLDNQMDEFNQLERLYKGNDLATESQDIVMKRAKRGIERTKTRLAMEKNRFKRTMEVSIPRNDWEKKTAVDRAKRNLAQQQFELPEAVEKKEQALEKAKKALNDAEKKLKELKEDAGRVEVKASTSGVVILGSLGDSNGVTTGPRARQEVKINQVLANIANKSTWRALVHVPLAKATKLSKGSEVSVRFPAAAIGNLKAKVVAKGFVANDNRITMQLEFTGEEAGKLILGVEGELE